MNYLKVYCNLIRKAENRTPPEGYTEKHHTFPVSIFGNNKRVVVLTAKEHYLTHLLLRKIYIKRYGLEDRKTIKMINALWFMSNNGKKYCNSTLYEKLRKNVSEIYIGDNDPAKRPEVIEKLKQKTLSLGDDHPMKQEHNRKRQSEMMKSNNPSKMPEVKDKLRQKMTGNKINLGRKYTMEQKELMSNQKCKITYKLTSPCGQIIITKKLKHMKEQYNLDQSCLLKVAKGQLNSHKGWKMQII